MRNQDYQNKSQPPHEETKDYGGYLMVQLQVGQVLQIGDTYVLVQAIGDRKVRLAIKATTDKAITRNADIPLHLR